jgi:hypothetical protein
LFTDVIRKDRSHITIEAYFAGSNLQIFIVCSLLSARIELLQGYRHREDNGMKIDKFLGWLFLTLGALIIIIVVVSYPLLKHPDALGAASFGATGLVFVVTGYRFIRRSGSLNRQ